MAAIELAESGPRAAPRRSGDLRQFRELVLHLARREVAARNRWTLLGAAWPLARQLAQLGVLVFVFSSVLDLGIDNFAVFVFSGLIAWTWFSTGLSDATRSVLAGRHLVLQPGLPAAVLPVVAAVVPLVDVALALPVLLVMLLATGDLHSSALLLPALLVIQLVLMLGIGWLTAAATVYLRDMPNLVLILLTLLFYLTPVFYDLGRVPERFQGLLRINPMTPLLESYRAALMGQPWPPATALIAVGVAGTVVAAAGFLFFRRLQPGFVDEL